MPTMLALVKAKPVPGLWLEEVPVPEPGVNDVLIKIHKTAICGTDVHIYNWDEWAQRTIPVPMPVGHEFVGRVAAVGSNVHDFKPGDLVRAEIHRDYHEAGRPHFDTVEMKGGGDAASGGTADIISIMSYLSFISLTFLVRAR